MKLHEYLEDHGILMAGMLLVFLLQCVLLVFLGMPAGLAILLSGMWLLFFLLYFIQDYHRKNRRRKELCAIIDSMEKRYLFSAPAGNIRIMSSSGYMKSKHRLQQ